MVKAKKRMSKRVSLNKKYKITRKVKEHKKKLEKDSKKNPKGAFRPKKDPGIPNSWPFKEELLQQIEKQKQQKEEERQKAKQRAAEERKRKRNSDQKTLAQMTKDASSRAKEFNKRSSSSEAAQAGGRNRDASRRAYFKEFRKVVEAADVILEVLDARDPMGCRCPEVEKAILKQDPSKRIILLLNKIDLVPKEVVEKWLTRLRNEYPTIAFKAATHQKAHIQQSQVGALHASSDLLSSHQCLGAENLLSLLKNYCRNAKVKTAITVGIIGFPNVGKSSVINSLKRSKAAGVANAPGSTKAMQEVHIDKQIKLLDCPGIVFSSNDTDPAVVLRNAVRVETIADPVVPVQVLLQRCRVEDVVKVYEVPAFKEPLEFLAHVARKRGKLRRGGVPDPVAAARLVLQDWNSGRIRFYCLPPAEAPGVHLEASVVAQWGKEFDVAALEAGEKAMLAGLPSADPDAAMAIESSAPLEADAHVLAAASGQPEEEDAMEDDEDEEEEDDEGEGSGSAMEDEGEEEEEAAPAAAGKGAGKARGAQATSGSVALEGEPAPQNKKRKGEAAAAAAAAAAAGGAAGAVQAAQQRALTGEEAAVNPQTNAARKKSAKKLKRDVRRGKAIAPERPAPRAPDADGEADGYSFAEAFADALEEGGGDTDD
eukprot:tig00001215_g7579.t1